MVFCEDLRKNLEICVASKSFGADNLIKWYHTIGDANLNEREEYQKKTELLLLNTFFSHFPEMEIENLTSESPDFIINYKGKRIGLEVSEIINHFELKKKESYINAVFRDVEKELNQYKSLFGIHYLDIDYQNPEIFFQQEKLTKEILSAITNNKKTGFVKNIRRTPSPKGVFLFLEYSFSLFDELDSEKILDVIKKKNSKYPLYDGKSEECWLVLVSNMYNMSSRYSYIHQKEKLRDVDSPFRRILHIENLSSQIISIK